MAKPVAVAGDTKVNISTANIPADANKTGRWQLVTSTITKGHKLSVDGKLVELSAQAQWLYQGGSVGTPPVPIPPVPDSAKLTAGPTKLRDGGKRILVDGDEAAGSVDNGNKIVVSASQRKLSTS